MDIGPFAEVISVGCRRDVRAAGGAHIVGVRAGVEAGLPIADFIRGHGAIGKVIDAAGVQLAVPGRVIEGGVEHDVDSGAVSGGDEVGELPKGGVARVGLAHERVHLEEVLHGVGAPDRIRLAGAGISLPSIHTDRVNRLKPEPVDAEVLGVGQVEAVGHGVVGTRAGAVVKVGEGAALIILRPHRPDVHGVQLIEVDVAGLLGGNHDGVVPARAGAVPEPVGVPGHLVAGGQAVRAGLLGIERQGVIGAGGGHGVGLVVIVVVARDNCIAVRWHNAVFDADNYYK